MILHKPYLYGLLRKIEMNESVKDEEKHIPLISVVLCSYNGERFINKQIESILNQTVKSVEIIIVDDCSTDNTLEIIKEIASLNANIKFYQNDRNLGFNKNFEKSISFTSGEYIAICDQDDIWLKNKLEVLLEGIGDNWLIFSNSLLIDEEDNLTGGELLESFDLTGRTFKCILLENFVTGHTTLFKRDFTKYILPFPNHSFYDWWLGFVALYHNKLAYINEHLTYYRVHPESVIQKEIARLLKDRNIKDKLKANQLNRQLDIFESYSMLKKEDYVFIHNLNKLCMMKDTSFKRLAFELYMHKNVYDFYPELRKRRFFSKTRLKEARIFAKMQF